jgi:hypothetical protein
LKNFHYTELFIYFNDFLNEDYALNLDAFILANQNLFFSYKKKKSNSESQEKTERKLLTKIFTFLTKQENKEKEKLQSNNNADSLEQISLLKYCICLGCSNTQVSDLFTFIDKLSKGSIEVDEFRIYLSNLLEFFFEEEKNINEKIREKDIEENYSNSQSDNQMQESIDRIIKDFLEKMKIKKHNNRISRADFNKIFNKHPELFEEYLSYIEKTEEIIFSKVFNFKFDSNNEENLNFLNNSDEGNFDFLSFIFLIL